MGFEETLSVKEIGVNPLIILLILAFFMEVIIVIYMLQTDG